MGDKILSVAIMEPFDGCEEQFLAVLRNLYTLLEVKGYSRDVLLRSHKAPVQYLNIRHWKSESARQECHEDPQVHRFWAQLGHLCFMRRVHELLDEVDWHAFEPSVDGKPVES